MKIRKDKLYQLYHTNHHISGDEPFEYRAFFISLLIDIRQCRFQTETDCNSELTIPGQALGILKLAFTLSTSSSFVAVGAGCRLR